MPELATTYLGLRLRTPLVASPSPLTGDLASLRDRRAVSAGGWFPRLDDDNHGLHRSLRHLQAAKGQLTVPVIASLNGTTPGGWSRPS